MPFGIKNAGFTYQRMMTRMFEPQLGKNIEIYINDMVVKSKLETKHVNDLRNIFEILRDTSCDLMLLSALSVSDQKSSWGIWLLTVELKSILIKLGQLIIYNHLGILKRSRS